MHPDTPAPLARLVATNRRTDRRYRLVTPAARHGKVALSVDELAAVCDNANLWAGSVARGRRWLFTVENHPPDAQAGPLRPHPSRNAHRVFTGALYLSAAAIAAAEGQRRVVGPDPAGQDGPGPCHPGTVPPCRR